MGWKNDEFDNDPRFAGIVANLLGALDIRERIGMRSPWFPAAMMAVTVAVLAAVLWYSYPKEAAEQELRAVPVIRAEAGPVKVVPGDPGGMDIPYRESTVFDTLRAGETERRVENLLPEAEKPIPREEMFAGLKTDLDINPAPAPSASSPPAASAAAADITEKQKLEATTTAAPVSVAASPEKTASAPAAAPETEAETQAAAKTEPAAGTPKAETTPKSGDYYVQLGSLKSRADAEKLWKDTQAAFPSQLGALSLRVQEADLGAKGTYYRVQGGPLAQADAAAACKAVEAKKPGGCLVVKR